MSHDVDAFSHPQFKTGHIENVRANRRVCRKLPD